MSKSVRDMSVDELDALVGGDDDDLAQDAMNELDRRIAERKVRLAPTHTEE